MDARWDLSRFSGEVARECVRDRSGSRVATQGTGTGERHRAMGLANGDHAYRDVHVASAS